MKLTLLALSKSLFIASVAVISFSASSTSDACPRIAWATDIGVFSGRSMDWAFTFNDVIYLNPRGAKMTGGGDGENQAE